MDAAVQVVVGATLTLGVPLVLAVHQILAARRHRDNRRDDNGPGPQAPKPPPYDWSRPLPDCLIPKPCSRRELEDV